MMKKLYETQSMLTEHRAIVTGCYKDDTGVKITLNESIFFPEGGGQYADKGVLEIVKSEDGSSKTVVRLLDGQEVKLANCSFIGSDENIDADGGRVVLYSVDKEIEPGTEVLCKLDWPLRFSRMQQHSGEHVLTGLIHNTYGYNNTSFHLSDTEPVTVCFSGPLTDEQIEAVEMEANRAIYENLPIVDTYPTKEELAGFTYRSKIEIEGQVRIITVGRKDRRIVDVCACCAPHVPSTAYVGIIKVISSQSYKGGTQLNILCGSRAFTYLRDEHRMVCGLSHDFSTSIESLPVIFTSQRDKLNEAEITLAGIREKSYLEEIEGLGEGDAPVFFAYDMSAHAMKICYNALTKKFAKFCGVFSGSDEEGYRFYAGNPELDSNVLARLMREGLEAKGGGSKEMVQGKLQKTKAEITEFFRNTISL